MTQALATTSEKQATGSSQTERLEPSAANLTALAKHFIASGYFRDATDVSKAVVKILAGREMGIGPFTAMSGINVIEGRITLSANLIAAQIKRSQRYNFAVKEHTEERCVLEFLEEGVLVGESSFSMADARNIKRNGRPITDGDNWHNYPRNMLFARAVSNGAKWFCPDVFGGTPVYTPDEIELPEVAAHPARISNTPPDNRYYCSEHRATWFLKTGKDGKTWYAHKQGDGWCNMRDAKLTEPDEAPLDIHRHAGADITDKEWQEWEVWGKTKYDLDPGGMYFILGKSRAEWTGTLRDAAELVLAAKAG